jgi:hypothetical protein
MGESGRNSASTSISLMISPWEFSYTVDWIYPALRFMKDVCGTSFGCGRLRRPLSVIRNHEGAGCRSVGIREEDGISRMAPWARRQSKRERPGFGTAASRHRCTFGEELVAWSDPCGLLRGSAGNSALFTLLAALVWFRRNV